MVLQPPVFAKHDSIRLGIISLISVLIITTLQDLLHSWRNGYAFHISESILFNSFWIWFFPGIALCARNSKRLTERVGNRSFFILPWVAAMLHGVLYIFSVAFISSFFYAGDYNLFKMSGYTLANDFYKYILVYGLTGMWLYRNRQELPEVETEKITMPEAKVYADHVIAGSGRNKTIIPIEDILFITAESPYIILYTKKKKYLKLQTLKTALHQLPPNRFIQVHKSAVVNLGKVLSYKSRLNGDYDIQLEDQKELRLSRHYALAFKQHWKGNSPCQTI